MSKEIVRAKVAVLGRGVQEFASEPPCTIEHALRSVAGTLPPSADVRLNGRPAPLSASLSDGDIVAVEPKIQGGYPGPLTVGLQDPRVPHASL